MDTKSPQQPRPRLTARGAVTRARIVEAAADLIYARGVAGTSMDDVMQASATSKSQLYHYFADKQALVREVITLATQRVLAAQQPQLGQLDSLAGLRRWRDVMIELNRATGFAGCAVGSLSSELADQSEDARERLAHSFQTWEAYIADGLQAIYTRGELAPEADPRDLATAIMTALEGGLLLAQATRSSRPLELALDMAVQHVISYCHPRSSADRVRPVARESE